MHRPSSALFLAAVALVLGPARAPAQVESAQARRDRFLQLIDRARAPLAPEAARLATSDRFTREHFTFTSEAGQRVPGVSAKLAGSAGRRPAVIVLHGTGDSKEGMEPIVDALADRGFLAVAIDGRHHGERAKGAGDYLQAILGAYRTGRGHPFLYDTVWDGLRLVDYLQSRPDVDAARIGMMGISKGGMETYLAAAADPRIAAAVPVIGVQSFGWALANDRWQPRVETILGAAAGAARSELTSVDAAFVQRFYDRVVPGIYSDFDAPEMLPLIAPRPLLVINGDSDALTPLAGVHEAADAAVRAYGAAGAPERFRLLIQPKTGHAFSNAAQNAALDWLARWLRP